MGSCWGIIHRPYLFKAVLHGGSHYLFNRLGTRHFLCISSCLSPGAVVIKKLDTKFISPPRSHPTTRQIFLALQLPKGDDLARQCGLSNRRQQQQRRQQPYQLLRLLRSTRKGKRQQRVRQSSLARQLRPLRRCRRQQKKRRRSSSRQRLTKRHLKGRR